MKPKTLINLPRNTHGKDYVVGDIHACVGNLEHKMREVGFNDEVDRLFCVGDLIDRGTQNCKAIELLLEPWFYSTLGNHEAMMLNKDYQVWFANGGTWWLELDNAHQRVLRKIVQDKCPVAYEVQGCGFRYGIVHAETPGEDWTEIDWNNPYVHEHALWGRRAIKRGLKDNAGLPPVKNIDIVFHGHTPTSEIVRLGNEVWCDLGVVFGKNEFALLDVEKEFKQLKYWGL